MKAKALLAWHFLADKDGKPVLRDGSPAPRVGEKLVVAPPLKMCEHGLHASVRAIDALEHAPGRWACRVDCGGVVIGDKDKLVCSELTNLGIVDATQVLHEFACECADYGLRVAGVTDERCWQALDIKLAWLAGLAGYDDLAAAWAARNAARDAARAAARDVAWAAANSRLTSRLLMAMKAATADPEAQDGKE